MIVAQFRLIPQLHSGNAPARIGSTSRARAADCNSLCGTTATEAWPARSQFDRHPDPSGCARAQDGIHHRDSGEAILNR